MKTKRKHGKIMKKYDTKELMMAEKYKLPRARYPEEAGVSGVEI